MNIICKSVIIISFQLLTVCGVAQEKSTLFKFNHLMNGIWQTEGKWSNGQSFKQEKVFSWGLNQKIVKVKTYGNIDQKSKKYGLRNEGIRAYNAQDSIIHFWEFDIYGGITEGICFFKNKDLFYEYRYHGQSLRESWLYVDEDTYTYQIESVIEGKRDKIFLESTYKRRAKH